MLSHVYQHARIALSDNPSFTLHERNFEIFAAGGFPLIKRAAAPDPAYVNPGWSNLLDERDEITHYLPEDEAVVLFSGKEEFLQKVAYYLDHPAQRERIAAAGRQIVRREFSTIAVAQKTMAHLARFYGAT